MLVVAAAGAFDPHTPNPNRWLATLVAASLNGTMHLPPTPFASARSREASPEVVRVLDVVAAFGAAALLVRTMTLIFPEALTTLAWTAAAVVLVAVGLVIRERVLRLVGLWSGSG